MDQALLKCENLSVTLATRRGMVKAVDQLSLSINAHQTYALLGESGCGKSMTAQAMMGILPINGQVSADSHVYLHQQDLLDLPESKMRNIRGRRIAMIFQEPMTSLNPVYTVEQQIREALLWKKPLSKQQCQQRCIELLEKVGIPDPQLRLQAYPHQLSGGMKQRVMIAVALAGEPELLIADEPTTALDVTIQAQILQLLQQLQQETGMAILLITHDLGVVKQVADRVGVMYAGQLVEESSAEQFFQQAKHPYSHKLFASLPSIEKRHQTLNVIKGHVPELTREFQECRFHPRCPFAFDTCREQAPTWTPLPDQEGVRCHLYQQPSEVVFEQPEIEPEMTTQHVLGQPVLSVQDLQVHFPIRQGLLKRATGFVKAVDGIDFSIQQGETVALVGESGCGKTTTGRSILQLIDKTSGVIDYHQLSGNLRQDIQIIFQDPFSSMNPRLMVKDIVLEGVYAQQSSSIKKQSEQLTAQLLEKVGLPAETMYRYPHEFSGGQRQRICIARALAVNPKLIICDEPTSALDVSVQAQILNLLQSLKQEFSLSYLFITHNMSVVAYFADRVLVMYQGKIVESGKTEDILTKPQHEYTQRLLNAVPQVS